MAKLTQLILYPVFRNAADLLVMFSLHKEGKQMLKTTISSYNSERFSGRKNMDKKVNNENWIS